MKNFKYNNKEDSKYALLLKGAIMLESWLNKSVSCYTFQFRE